MKAWNIGDRIPWILAAVLLALGLSGVALGATVGYWRFDDPGATDGGSIGTALTEVNSAALNATGASGVIYTDSVPGKFIYDPVSGISHANEYALHGPGSVEYVNVPNSTLLDTANFTIEMFIRLIGQPGSYDSSVRRSQLLEPGKTQRMQIDFSGSSSASSFGKIRARFDNFPQAPAVPQTNIVPTGDYIFVDTDSGSGDPADYTGATGDVRDEGDDINDDLSWHHVALTYDATAQTTTIFTDYQQGSSRTFNDPFTHPSGVLQIGNFYSGYGLMIDEFRYSDSVLTADQFLWVVPEPSTLVLLALGSLAILGFRRRARNDA